MKKPENASVGLLVVSHGNLALELLDAAGRILGGDPPQAVPLCMDWNADSTTTKEQIRKAIRRLLEEKGQVLILTDLFGGTPTNLSMTFYQPGSVEILTGVNLPMLIRALMVLPQNMPLRELLESLKEKGQSAIVSVSEVLDPPEGPGR